MTINSGTYRIKNVKSGTYLDESVRNPGQVHGWSSRPDNANQRWEVQQDGIFHRIRNVQSGQYLSVSGTSNGTDVRASGNETHWFLSQDGDAYFVIVKDSDNASMDLDMGRNDDGAAINVWKRSGAAQQKWRFESVGGSGGQQHQQWQGQPQQGMQQMQNQQSQYTGALFPGTYLVRNVHTGTALDLSGASNQDGTRVIGYQAGNGNNQKWVLEPGSKGYRIKNNASGTFAGFGSGEQPTDGVLLTGNRNAVEWAITQADQGYQIHLASNQNLVLDLASGDASDGAKICLWSNKGGNNQKWNFQKV